MYCKDCKFSTEAGLPGNLDCTNPKFAIGYGYDTAPDDAAWIEDDEGWAWYVGPNFGCIHFEPK